LHYGTLGLKISAGGKTIGFSGDTKFDEKINKFLKRDELLPQWFAYCILIFHEIDFYNPNSARQSIGLPYSISCKCSFAACHGRGNLLSIDSGNTVLVLPPFF
jgi:hypothetical protein